MKKFFILILFLFPFSILSNIFDFGSLISPGKLSKYHSFLNGVNNCFNCHTKGKGVQDSNCLKCHKEINSTTSDKTSFHGNTSKKCAECHKEHDKEHKGENFEIIQFDKKSFNHKKTTKFNLAGKHEKLACEKCHKKFRRNVVTFKLTNHRTYLGLNSTCTNCHENIHKLTKRPLQNCSRCHSENTWKERKENMLFNHSTDTDYPLLGKHATIPCTKCHKDKKFGQKTGTDCGTCHKPKHGNKFGNDCLKCHNHNNWKADLTKIREVPQIKQPDGTFVKAKFKHTTDTYFNCAKCHKDIHNKQFEGKKCEDCHKSVEKWNDLKFIHNKDSSFSLHSTHADLTCQKCHVNAGVYRNIGKKCIDCHMIVHRGDYGNSKADMLVCDKCHNEFQLTKTDFNHALKAKITFEGKHSFLKCSDCHVLNRDQKTTSASCKYCHRTPHKGKSFEICVECHNQVSFKDVNYSHNRQSEFKLDGTHNLLSCRHCHLNGFENMENKACSNCHADVHKDIFGSDCEKCHSTKDFSKIYYPHKSGKYMLSGAHDKLACSACHQKGKFVKGKITFCKECHQDPHINSFGNSCLDCHSQTSWLPTTFRHNQTGFDLDGAHRFVECNGCHKNRVYGGVPTACFYCHKNDLVLQGDHIKKDNFKSIMHCELCHFTTNWFPVKRRR